MANYAGIRFEAFVRGDLAERRREAVFVGVSADKGEYAPTAVVAIFHNQGPFPKLISARPLKYSTKLEQMFYHNRTTFHYFSAA